MGTLVFNYTCTGSEGRPATYFSQSIQQWTGAFTIDTVQSAAAGALQNFKLELVRSSDGFVCWSSASSFAASDTVYHETWTVGVPSLSWHALNWDTVRFGIDTALGNPPAGRVFTITFDGAGITAANYAAVAYKLTVGSSSSGTDTRYQLLSEKDQANGYAGLDANVRVPTVRLGSGTADSTTFLRGDQTWAAPSGGGGGSGALVSLSTQTLSAVAAFVDFTLPTSGYSEVRLNWQTQLDGGTTPQECRLRLNSDTGTNYNYGAFHGAAGASTVGFGFDNLAYVRVGNIAPNSVTNTSSAGEVRLPDFLNTIWFKQIDATFFNIETAMSAAQSFAGMVHGTWRNTAAVTTVRLYPGANNFRIGSVFRLYGVT
jgi:hypothetical protein